LCGDRNHTIFAYVIVAFDRGNLAVQRIMGCLWRWTSIIVCLIPLIGAISPRPAAAAGPFADFKGSWSGTGTLRPTGHPVERIRCDASYRPRGSTEHEVDLHLQCSSDSYKFDLGGEFSADAQDRISGRWTEHSRNIGGTAIGSARGDRVQLHIESSAFAADVVMTTRSRRQEVVIDSHGGGQVVKASITLHRS
jgi:hypothetical protein